MLEQFKQLRELKNLQKKLSKEEIEHEKNGVKVKINGKMEVTDLKLNSKLNHHEQAKATLECLNQAMKKAQSRAAELMYRKH